MGVEVERSATDRGLNIVRIFNAKDNPGGRALNEESLNGVDVCIDFSTPAAVIPNIEAVASCGRNIVIGTTGWYDRMEYVKGLVKERNIGFLYSANFSIGVNVFLNIAMNAARVIGNRPEYDVAIHEVHHRAKTDSPSGTALSLGAVLLQHVSRKTELFTETSHGQIKPHQLHVTSARIGDTTGRHTVTFDSDIDTIELVHTAKNRRGYAVGAIVAAEWLKGKKGWYTMQDVIS